MGTVETRSTTLVPSSATGTPEPAKAQAPKEKSLKEALESCSTQKSAGPKSLVEGCVEVKNEGLSGDLGQGAVDTDISSQRGSSDVEKGGLAESTHSLRRGSVEKFEDGDKASNGEKGGLERLDVSLDENGRENGELRSMEVPIEDLSESNDGEVEDMGEEGHKFLVGDFVWGKVRSHPWWPGQIYDPSYASEFAAKKKVKDRYLVAYFGDGTFAWCPPSQLKPFEENFDEMSKQSNMKTFVSAVQQAIDEIGRLLELKMICSCVPKENRTGLGQPLAENAGIKEGVLVPDGESRKLSGVFAEPSELLAELKRVGHDVYLTNGLELKVLRSRLSAFYRTRGGYDLPEYHDPKPVSGLDDGVKSVEVPTQGPFEEWLPSPMSVDTIQANEGMLQSSPVVSESKKTHRRKQRSMADLIGESKKTTGGKLDSEEKSSEKSAPPVVKNGKDTKDEEMATDETNSEKSAPRSGTKKRKDKEESDSQDDSLISLKGKRRKAGLLGFPVSTSSDIDSSVKKGGDLEKQNTKEGLVSKGRTKKKGINIECDDSDVKTRSGIGSGSRNLNLDIGSVKSDESAVREQLELASSPRERKKSKYLSPPFTMLNSGKRRREMEAELLRFATEVSMEGKNAVEADQNVVSSPISKDSSEALQNHVSTEPGPGDVTGKSLGSSPIPKTPTENPNKIIDGTKANVPANELLSEVLCVAVNPFTPRGKKSQQMVGDFISLYRSLVYLNGPNYKLYNKRQSRRKRKNLDSESGSQKEDPEQTAEKSTEQESGRRKVKNQKMGADKPKEKGAVDTPDVKLDKQKPMKGAGSPEAKKVDKESVEGKSSPAALFVTFGPGSSLPTKASLIQMYGKYGELDETETEMFYNNFCARVSFNKISNAEVAFNDSQTSSPFGNASVSFRLQYHSGAFKTRELSEISRRQRNASPLQNNVTTPKKPRSQPKGSSEADLNFIKEKLEKISSMLEDKTSKVSPRTKSKLQAEINELLEKVGTMVGGSSS
ncbi:PWWP domain-containing protein 3 [Humulus lupulus]|uniref:PWWP domain-containing protein 3 n=1 Tax=Humulus lupulus TaxID=3486 RepID=UPI002B409243|nr:PWWP domain-containing protein 3 [Humulus lupulus]XP_062106903.1 PWWP domain-containing protein 3 [Humulus lupulus]